MENIVQLVAVIAPFVFVYFLVKFVIESKQNRQQEKQRKTKQEKQDLGEFEAEILDLMKRIENLEIILRSKKSND
ncbi:MAG: hypothetical protein ACOX0W_04640 [Sphaerochaetaceae bacterium]|jgi:hypothetical protein